MNRGWIPDAWQTEALSSHVKHYALVELASLAPGTRTALFEAFEGDSAYWPLLDDDTQPHLQREGPWLLAVNESRLNAWQSLDTLHCAFHAGIESTMTGERLAARLAPAMVAYPEGEPPALLRFYLPDVIQKLYTESQAGWHRPLFGGIEQWWWRDERQSWQILGAMPTLEPLASSWQLALTPSLYQKLQGDPELASTTRLLTERHPDLFTDLCSCACSQRVKEALKAAIESGLMTHSERLTFVYGHLLTMNQEP